MAQVHSKARHGCQRGAILLPLKHLSSNCIISTLFYCLTIEQFLMQPDPGCTTKCIKNCTSPDLGCIINCTLPDFGCIINCTPPDFGCIKKCTPSRNCARIKVPVKILIRKGSDHATLWIRIKIDELKENIL